MTKAHPHRQVNVHLDTVDDVDIIERIEAQPSMVGYVRELVRRDIHDERLDYVALKESGLQAENAKLRELVRDMWRFTGTACKKYPKLFDPGVPGGQMVYPNMLDSFEQRMRELGVEVES